MTFKKIANHKFVFIKTFVKLLNKKCSVTHIKNTISKLSTNYLKIKRKGQSP